MHIQPGRKGGEALLLPLEALGPQGRESDFWLGWSRTFTRESDIEAGPPRQKGHMPVGI
jgi:hypothetical protein